MVDSCAVIITAFNSENTILACIESVVLSDESPSLIVINDGSTDCTHDIILNCLASYDFIYRSQDNKGLSAARDFGVRLSKERYVTFLDADDLYVDGRCQLIADIHDRLPSPSILFTRTMYNSKNSNTDLKLKLITSEFVTSKLRPSGASVSFSVDLYESIGGFDPSIRRNSELDFFARSVSNNIDFYIFNAELYNQIVTPGSNSTLTSYRIDSLNKIYSKFASDLENTNNATFLFLRNRANLMFITSFIYPHCYRKQLIRSELYKFASPHFSIILLLSLLLPHKVSFYIFHLFKKIRGYCG